MKLSSLGFMFMFADPGITDMNVLETSKHLDPLGIFPGGDRTDMESQVK